MSEHLHPQMISDSENTILSLNKYLLSPYSMRECILTCEDTALSIATCLPSLRLQSAVFAQSPLGILT